MNIQSASLEELNVGLEEGLTKLREEMDRETIQQVSARLNEILYSAIAYHASNVNAAQIQTKADVSRDCTDLPDRGHRPWLKDYIKKATKQEEIEGVVPFLFTMHLPFRFTTGTHGSGERAAVGASIENMAFEPLGWGEYAPVAFQLDLGGGGLLFRKEVYFLPEEIESVKLTQVQDSEFSPFYQGWNKPLESAGSALGHYLNYRGFVGYAVTPEDIPEVIGKERIVSLMRSVSIPEHSTGLFRKELGKRSISGFAAVRTDGKIEVYEFDNVELPKRLVEDYFFGEDAACAAYAIGLHRDKQQPNIKVYTGSDAITRLHGFGTERKF